MITVAIVTRRLKEGKTYEDFRKAWYHTVGFGTASKLYTMINAFDPREITIIGFVETNPDMLQSKVEINIEQRLENPLDEIIEPQITRKFGVLVADDDFSAEGSIQYTPASIEGKTTNLKELSRDLHVVAGAIRAVSKEHDSRKIIKSESDAQ